MTSIRKHRGFMFLLYVLVFLLLLEWLTPIAKLTATGYQTIFLVFLAGSLFMAFFQVTWWISSGLKVLYILWALLFIFTEHRFFTRDAIAAFGMNIETSLIALFSQNWTGVTDMFRTLLFFVLLWMAVYLLHYWIGFRLSIFTFYLFTVIFVAVLDTFSPYSGDAAIIRIMVIGLMLAGLLHLARWLELHHIPLRRGAVIGWLVPLFLMVSTSAAAALLLPKADPIWPDPVPYLTSHTTSETASSGKSSIGKIGYDQDDSRLGGSFVGDDTVVLRAELENGQYWKIESKDVYTSRGWELSEVASEPIFYGDSEPIDALDIEPGTDEEQETAFISMAEERFPFVLYPYGTESFTMEGSANYRYNPADQRIGTYRAGSTFEPYMYEVTYSEPTYSLKALRATAEDELAALPDELDRYLQLPETLPERVRDLTVAITDSEETVYGKARAIEAYFANGEFTYSQTNVPIPAEGQDYVDQFLFETQIGYCDNFSTSMVVMLRSLGIPARWVKGFTEGEEIRSTDGKSLYEVTNNNAHSWVEAYMPNVGWVMFEPTIGFGGSINIDFDLDLEDSEEEAAPVPEKPDKPEPAETEAETAAAGNGPGIGKQLVQFWAEQQSRILWGLLVTLAAGLVLYFLRRKWLPSVLIPYYRMRRGEESFERAYLHLLRQLDLYGIQRKEGETLSAYADYIDKFFGTRDMTVLTEAYEQTVYGGLKHTADWGVLRKNWESLINRTSG